MAVSHHFSPTIARWGGLLALLLAATGCQMGRPAAESKSKFLEHVAAVDFSGLKPAATVPNVKATAAAPERWVALRPYATALYIHQQWRSPSSHTGMGIAYVHLPLPLSAKAVVWLAKGEYSKKSDDGRVIREWSDDLGRAWFEAANNKYHVQGYAVTQGFRAWIVYVGYKVTYPPDLPELALAGRCLESVVPDLDDKLPDEKPVAVETKASATQPSSRVE